MNAPEVTLKARPKDGHKGTFGHALLVAGAEGMAGAAVLAARACLRSGVGKLSVQSAPANRVVLQCCVPEAVLGGGLSGICAVGIGPGLGQCADLLASYMREWGKPMVIDADALNALAADPSLWPLVPPGSVLTPHGGELARLGVIPAGYHVVRKGHPTVVLHPDGSAWTCQAGNSGMATAGSGDVLTGIITGLMAQGYAPGQASELGVWLHAAAGDAAAEMLGEECMLASDIIAHLPEAFRKLKTMQR